MWLNLHDAFAAALLLTSLRTAFSTGSRCCDGSNACVSRTDNRFHAWYNNLFNKEIENH